MRIPSLLFGLMTLTAGSTVALAPLETGDEAYLPGPAWFQDSVAEAAEGAARSGRLYEVHADADGTLQGGVPVAPDYLFVRPGALLILEKANGKRTLCTSNFIYTNGTQIGTAGHCAERVGQPVYILAAPVVPVVAYLGTVQSFTNTGPQNDWALIDILPQWSAFVDPNVAYVGGPACAAWSGTVAADTLVKHVGHGTTTGLVTSVPRAARLTYADGQRLGLTGVVSPGDSGGPLVVANDARPGCELGAALGIVTGGPGGCSTACTQIYGTDIRQVPATVTTGWALSSAEPAQAAPTAAAGDAPDACHFIVTGGRGDCTFDCTTGGRFILFMVGAGTATATCNGSTISCMTSEPFPCYLIGHVMGPSGVEGHCQGEGTVLVACGAVNDFAVSVAKGTPGLLRVPARTA